MKITAPFRGRRASKRLDLTDMRAAFRDQRMWCSVGLVTDPGDGGLHYEVLVDDVHVEVVLQPSLVPVTCRLTAGMWRIPDIGEEVMVTLPEGALEFMPTIIDVLSSGRVPTTQGPTLGRVVIARAEVVVHDGNGGANPLPTLASLQAAIDKINVMIGKYKVHTHGGVLAGGSITAVPTDVTLTTAADAVGTTCLKGK